MSSKEVGGALAASTDVPNLLSASLYGSTGGGETSTSAEKSLLWKT